MHCFAIRSQSPNSFGIIAYDCFYVCSLSLSLSAFPQILLYQLVPFFGLLCKVFKLLVFYFFMDPFLQAKTDTLKRIDKSYKGSWDKHILKLCNKINFLSNYYTTSSCSGRVVVMVEQRQKDRELFLFTSHEKINFLELKVELEKIVLRNKKDLIKFKFDPCILHVACKNLENADKLLKKSQLAGWKRNGIISSVKRIIVELNSTEKLEFPVIKNGKILVGDEFLKLVVEKSNKKFKLNWEKISKFEKLI